MASSNDKIEIKLEKLCRTCLSKDNELNSLFDVNVQQLSLDFIVTAITGLKIRKGDGLPNTICCECRDKAEKAFDFKKKSEESYNSLKGFYKDEKCHLFEYDDNNTQKSVDFKTEDSQLFNDHDDFSDADYSVPLENGPTDLNNIEVKVKVKHESSNREYFECKKCCLIFQTRAKYQEHKKTKCVKVEYEDPSGAHCPICGTSYDGANSLSNHMWQFHADLMGPKKRGRPKKAMTSTILSKLSENGFFIKSVQGKKIKCGFCKEQANTKEDLSVHMFEHSDVKVLCCILCKKMYLKKIKFDSHPCVEDASKAVSNKAEIENTHDSANRKVSLAAEVFLQELLDPDWETNANVIQVCVACSAVFLSEGDLISHHDADHPELSLRCNHCTKVFASVKTAARHRTVCKDIDRTHRCSTCGLKFTYEISLNKHILRYHRGERVSIARQGKQSKPTDNVQYQCDTCNKFFQRKEALAKHAKLHMPNQKVFECEICQRKFNRSDNLRTHKRIHDVDRPKAPTNNHLCLYCGRGFSNSSNLIVHMRRHTGEKPYKCEFCEKGFPRSSDLMVHRRSHTGEKPCVCRICGKAFSRSNKLSRHMRVHTGQRPYKCTYCDKAFSQSNDLTLHVRRHTGDRPYICEVCGDRFIQGTALQNHRRAHGHFSAPPGISNQVQAITYAVANITHHDDSHLSNTIASI